MRIANRPRRGIGDTSIQRLVAHATALGISLWDATADPEAAGVATASARAIRGFRTIIESLMSAAQELEIDELVERVLERSGTIEALRGRADDRGAGPDREPLRSSSAPRRSTGARAEEPSLSGFLEEVQLQSDQDTLARRHRAGDADDDPQREGARVPRRLPDRDGGGDLPALALDRGQRGRGGAPPRVRRDDAGDGAADADPRHRPLALRPARVQPRLSLPGRAPGNRYPGAPAARLVVRLRAISPAGAAARESRGSLACRPATPSVTGRSARASSPGSSRTAS